MPALGIEIKRKCPICGKVFIIKTLDSIYCLTECSKIAYKRKKDTKKKELISVAYGRALRNSKRIMLRNHPKTLLIGLN